MKVGSEITPPHAIRRSEQTLLGEQKHPGAAPGAELEQAVVMPQVVDGLAQQVAQQEKRVQAHPTQAPFLVAIQGFVDVKGGASVFAFLAGMPMPQGLQAWFGMGHEGGVGQQPVRQDRCEMFGGRGGGDRVQHIHAFKLLNAFARPWCPVIHQALVFQVLVEQTVQTPVRGFLPYKALELSGKPCLLLRCECLLRTPQAVDEKLLAHRKTHGQGIHESRRESVAPIPSHRKGRFQVKQQFANDELTHGVQFKGSLQGPFTKNFMSLP